MRHHLKQSMKAVLAILAGALLTTGGVSFVEADSQSDWHHGHTFTASSATSADGICAYGCSQLGHSQYRVQECEGDPGTWHCECKG